MRSSLFDQQDLNFIEEMIELKPDQQIDTGRGSFWWVIRGVCQMKKPREFNGSIIIDQNNWRQLEQLKIKRIEHVIGMWPDQYLVKDISFEDAKNKGSWWYPKNNVPAFVIPLKAWRNCNINES